MGKIISFSNQKGGVGKTTYAVNVAASLGILDRKILRDEISDHGKMKCRLISLLMILLRYVCPILLMTIFLYNLGIFEL